MSTQIKDIIRLIEQEAPLKLQESYDNAGIQAGDAQQEVKGVLICVDTTEAVVDEAIERGANLIVGHHPVIFGGLKRLTGKTDVERTIMKALRHNIVLYAAHTNLDAIAGGVNAQLCNKLGMVHCRVLAPQQGYLRKLVVFAPLAHTEKVRKAIFDAGAGQIGEYDQCSYNLEGQGTFRPGQGTNPFTGERGQLHLEEETRIETIYPAHVEAAVLSAMQQAHPYEEVAYDIYPLKNAYPMAGMGMSGQLPEPMPAKTFLQQVKQALGTSCLRHTSFDADKKISRVAVAGGSGSFLINQARAKADIFLTADLKYHQFFEGTPDFILADIGHYESEQFAKDWFYHLITKNFSNFAVYLTNLNTNPINYL